MKKALEKAKALYADMDIFSSNFSERLEKLEQLPTCCFESADSLLAKREVFENNNIFPAGTINAVADSLKAYQDNGLNDRILGNHQEIMDIVEKYIHCM